MAFPSQLDYLRPLNGTFEGNRGAGYDISPGESAELIKVENGCIQGECIGVTLGIAVIGKLTANEGILADCSLLPLPRARVEWGTGNSRLFVDVDFLEGTSLAVIAESLSVHVSYDFVAPPWVDPESEGCNVRCLPNYRLQASLGYGGGCRGARYTEVAFVETPGARTKIAIPPFASTFTVLPINNTLVSAHLRGYGSFYQVTDVIVAPLSNLGQSNRVDQIPIPNGMRWVEIENREASAPASAFVVFGLGL